MTITTIVVPIPLPVIPPIGMLPIPPPPPPPRTSVTRPPPMFALGLKRMRQGTTPIRPCRHPAPTLERRVDPLSARPPPSTFVRPFIHRSSRRFVMLTAHQLEV